MARRWEIVYDGECSYIQECPMGITPSCIGCECGGHRTEKAAYRCLARYLEDKARRLRAIAKGFRIHAGMS